MKIDALKTDDRPDIGWARITLSLGEIETITATLNELDRYSKLHADMFLLFELVQKGVVDNMTHSICMDLARKREVLE